MRFKAVFLDAGGTLMRERASRAGLYAAAARRRGLAVSDAEMARCMYRVHAELPRTAAGAFRYSEPWFALFIERIFLDYMELAPHELPALQAELFARFADPETFELLPGALDLVHFLHDRRVPAIVVSNWSEALPGLLEGLGLEAYLAGAVVSASAQAEKPEPALFQCALRLLESRLPDISATPAAVVHLGDRVDNDVAGARAAGLSAALYDPEDRARHALDVPRFASLAGFQAWLQPRLDSPPA